MRPVVALTAPAAPAIKSYIQEKLGVPEARRTQFANQLPCCHPVSANGSLWRRATPTDFYVSVKADGTRYYIVRVSSDTQPLVVDRVFQAAMLQGYVPPDTILDAELVDMRGRTTFLLLDVMRWAGQDMCNTSFAERVQLLHSPDLRQQIQLAAYGVAIKHQYAFTDERWRTEQAPFPTDGYILTNWRDTWRCGRARNVLRVKPTETLDVEINEEGHALLAQGTTARIPILAYVENHPHPGIWECAAYYDGALLVLTPQCQRYDKNEPNDLSVLENLQATLQDPLVL